LKKISVTVILNQSNNVVDVFEKLNLPVIRSDLPQGDKSISIFSALIPDELVDDAIGELTKRIDLRIKENTIVVHPVDAFVSTALSKIKERISKEKSPKSSLEQLINETDKHVRLNKDIVTMALFATIVAFAGLVLDNVAILIGAMLLSPLLGPLNAFAVNTNLGRLKKAAIGQLSILGLLASIVILSAVITLIVSRFINIPLNSSQIVLRMHANYSDIVIALVLGLAGGLALFIALPELLVGIAVAVALVPPATVAGLGLALENAGLFAGALTLTFVYVIGLELGSCAMLQMKRVSPRYYYQKNEIRLKFAYSMIILVALFVFLAGIIYFLNV
jgi:uncharacterized hydrophobic protein (TIGR00341 family)